jgi:transposase InsO family protein
MARAGHLLGSLFIQLESRRVALAGVTKHPDAVWMEQIARNAVDPESGHLRNQRYILHDRDTKFGATFRSILESAGTKCLTLPPRSPNSNAYSERWVRSAKEECLRKLILFGEGSLRRAMADYVTHFHSERNGSVALMVLN